MDFPSLPLGLLASPSPPTTPCLMEAVGSIPVFLTIAVVTSCPQGHSVAKPPADGNTWLVHTSPRSSRPPVCDALLIQPWALQVRGS